MSTDNFEELLKRKSDAENHILPVNYDTRKPFAPPTTAQKASTLEEFMEMIGKLVSKTMKKKKVEFSPDEGARPIFDSSKPIDHPYIFYEVLIREPKTERKPRSREDIVEVTMDDGSKRHGRIWGQKFKCIVQFNILASDYRTANEVMNNFESLIFNYTAYFKKNGVAEILFEKHFTDKNLDPFRQSLSIRTLQYYVEVEKLFTEFLSDIEDVFIE